MLNKTPNPGAITKRWAIASHRPRWELINGVWFQALANTAVRGLLVNCLWSTKFGCRYRDRIACGHLLNNELRASSLENRQVT